MYRLSVHCLPQLLMLYNKHPYLLTLEDGKTLTHWLVSEFYHSKAYLSIAVIEQKGVVEDILNFSVGKSCC